MKCRCIFWLHVSTVNFLLISTNDAQDLKNSIWGKTGEPKRYANPKQINKKAIFLLFSLILKIDSDKLTIFKGIYALRGGFLMQPSRNQ